MNGRPFAGIVIVVPLAVPGPSKASCQPSSGRVLSNSATKYDAPGMMYDGGTWNENVGLPGSCTICVNSNRMLMMPTALSVLRSERIEAGRRMRRRSSGGTDGSVGAVFETVSFSCALVATSGSGRWSVGAIDATVGSGTGTGVGVGPEPAGGAVGNETGCCCVTLCGALLGIETGVAVAVGIGGVEPPS